MLVVQQLAGDRHDGGADAVRQRKDPDSNGALVLVPRGTNNLIEKVGKEQINSNRQPGKGENADNHGFKC